jgi:uncharacterized delta-60 repeat protein
MSTSSQTRPRAPRTGLPSPAPSRKRPAARLELEPLEDRQLLSGGLDPTFALGGKRTIPLPDSAATQWATAVAVQADGKVVLAGQADDGSSSNFEVVRLNVDGTTDTTFGNAGTVLVAFTSATSEQVSSLAIDANGKILVAGTATTTGSDQSTDTQFAVARLNADGSLDTTFNNGGTQTIEVGGQSPLRGSTATDVSLDSLVLQTNGKILLAGTVYTRSTFQTGNAEQLVVARLLANGQADANYGSGGMAMLNLDAATTSAVASAALALQADGKAVLAATTGSPATADVDAADNFSVMRLTTSGQIDSTFGSGGKVSFAFGTNLDNEVAALVVQADGKLVVGGMTAADFSPAANPDFALARLTADGQLDTTFNSTGKQTVAFDLGGLKADRLSALAIQDDGKILAAGSAVTGTVSQGLTTQPSTHFAIARLQADGTPDQTFGSDGQTDFGFEIGGFKDDRATAVALQPDGKLVVAGAAGVDGGGGGVDAMAVARVLTGDHTSTIGVFDPTTATWYLRDVTTQGAPSLHPFAYGGAGWIPVVGDWDGDGEESIGVFDPRTATWYLKNSNRPGAPDYTPFQFGAPGNIPVVGDWDGNGTTTVGVFDPTTGAWYLRNSNSAGPADVTPFIYGGKNWTPVVGDWNGDGVTTVGVVDPQSRWFLRNSNSQGGPDVAPFLFGTAGMKPVVGDWNGDGIDTAAEFDSSAGWHIRNSNAAGKAAFPGFAYGAGNWVPVAGDWAMESAALRTGRGQNPVGPVTGTATDQDLANLVNAALSRLADAGADPALLTRLSKATVAFGSLPGGQLAVADTANQVIVFDTNAAGYGWFVDSTPGQDEEFQNGRAVSVGSNATTRVDLLSAIMLELGQLMGLDRTTVTVRGLTLDTGVRNVDVILSTVAAYTGGPPASNQAPVTQQSPSLLTTGTTGTTLTGTTSTSSTGSTGSTDPTTGQPTMTLNTPLPGLGLPGISTPLTNSTGTQLGSTMISAGPSIGGIVLNDQKTTN